VRVSLFLDKEEVEALTGYRRFKAQCRELTRRGIPHMTRGDGSPIVILAALERHRKRRNPTEEEVKNAYYEAKYEDHRRSEEPWEFEGISPIGWIMANWRRFILPVADIIRRAEQFDVVRRRESAPEPAKAYVYFLLDEWEIFYVGKTRNQAWRYDTHQARFGDRLSYLSSISVPTFYVEQVEAFYIHLLRPPENIKYPGLSQWANQVRFAYESGAISDPSLTITESPLTHAQSRTLQRRIDRHAEATAPEPIRIMPLARLL
jgi:Domain of unknown function (DUF4224)